MTEQAYRDPRRTGPAAPTKLSPVRVERGLPRVLSPAVVAVQGKGGRDAAIRARQIATQYGVGPGRMEHRLATVAELVERAGCTATLPVPAIVVARHPQVFTRFAARGIEFAVHGHRHVDHEVLAEEDQVVAFGRARMIFERAGLSPAGFRAPYLRWSAETLDALRMNDFSYDASQAMYWPVDPAADTAEYHHGLDFCGALPASDYPVVPWCEGDLVRIPYVLPDDESAVYRLQLDTEAIAKLWLAVLRDTHDRGELFTLAVHPERIDRCAPAISAVFAAARACRPRVWIARHDDIARWWRDRASAAVTTSDEGDGRLRVAVRGPVGTVFLARRLPVASAVPWSDGYTLVPGDHVVVPAERRPFVGVHPSSPRSLATFLREQGYIVETSDDERAYTCYLRHERFEREDQQAVLAGIDETPVPLLRLARWPDAARSALALTGDVDALTIRDYAFRFVGR
jgi:peptidoglycan/xylan/chitin deacetylase (PgdA/CDA1 family)